MSQRIAKIESLIQHIVAAGLTDQLEADAAAITVTRVDVSPDMRQAIIWLGVLGPERDHERLMKRVMGRKPEIQAIVAARLTTKFVPRLDFKLDTGGAYAAEIDRLLRKAR
jgi:ribosome-binding factor A